MIDLQVCNACSAASAGWSRCPHCGLDDLKEVGTYVLTKPESERNPTPSSGQLRVAEGAKCKRCNGTGEVEGYGGNNIYCGHCAGTGKDLMSQVGVAKSAEVRRAQFVADMIAHFNSATKDGWTMDETLEHQAFIISALEKVEGEEVSRIPAGGAYAKFIKRARRRESIDTAVKLADIALPSDLVWAQLTCPAEGCGKYSPRQMFLREVYKISQANPFYFQCDHCGFKAEEVESLSYTCKWCTRFFVGTIGGSPHSEGCGDANCLECLQKHKGECGGCHEPYEMFDPSELPVWFDYTNNAWVKDGVYVKCGHRPTDVCGCYGRAHEGEVPLAEITFKYGIEPIAVPEGVERRPVPLGLIDQPVDPRSEPYEVSESQINDWNIHNDHQDDGNGEE